MRYVIETVVDLVFKNPWIILIAIIVLLVGTFGFPDIGSDCENYCGSLWTGINGRVSDRWEERGREFVMISQPVEQAVVYNDDFAPWLIKNAKLGDSIVKPAGSNDALLIRGRTITRFKAQTAWDSCDCSAQ